MDHSLILYKAMINKLLIQCGNCEVNGKREILGEIDEDGNLSVMRFHNGKTILLSNNYSVICGGCGNIVFNKQSTNSVSENIWV